MAGHWYIHSRDKTMGPWTPAQIREELRLGRIDPFDMVSKEGSPLKRPLVEVDELFQSSRIQLAEVVLGEAAKETTPPLQNVVGAPPVQSVPEPPKPRPSQFQALAAELRLVPPERKPRRYFVTDSMGRRYGPLSSREVMKLWNDGTIDGRAVVERLNNPRRIEIGRFIAFYTRAEPSGLAFVPPNMGEERTHQPSKGSALSWLSVLIAVAAVGYLGYNMKERQLMPLKRPTPQNSQSVKKNTYRFDMNIAKPSPKSETKDMAPSPSVIRPVQAPKKSSPPPRQSSAVKPPSRSTIKPLPKKPVPKLAALPPMPTPMPKVKPPAAKVAPWQDGQTVTLRGYKFSKAAFGSCAAKCRLLMVGPSGPITAVFFKSAFASAFKDKPGGLSISGIVRRGESGSWTLVVSDVD